MYTLGQRKLYDFRMQSLSEVQAVLTSLLNERKRLEATGIATFGKMYKYIEPLHAIAMMGDSKDAPLLIVDQFLLTFLDADLVKEVLLHPDDADLRNALAIQLGFIAAGTNNIPNIDSYTDEELKLIFKGDGSFYDEAVFVYTLREMVSGQPDSSIISALFATLRPVTELDDIEAKYFWDDAFVLSMMLHVIWKNIGVLSNLEQQTLLQNYFYRAIVAGVPVRVWLAEAAEERPETMIQWSQMLSRSREHVPTNTRERTGEAFSSLVNRYLAEVLGEQISTLAQEKFLKTVYQNQPNKEVYSVWLREALVIVYHVKNGDLLEYSYE